MYLSTINRINKSYIKFQSFFTIVIPTYRSSEALKKAIICSSKRRISIIHMELVTKILIILKKQVVLKLNIIYLS